MLILCRGQLVQYGLIKGCKYNVRMVYDLLHGMVWFGAGHNY
jgi:hypothetical protein